MRKERKDELTISGCVHEIPIQAELLNHKTHHLPAEKAEQKSQDREKDEEAKHHEQYDDTRTFPPLLLPFHVSGKQFLCTK
jgi:hypothetical protein